MTKRAVAVIIQPPASGAPAQLWRILDGVLLGPFTRSLLVLLPVGLVGVCNLGHQRIVGVGVGQHGADRQKNYSQAISIVEKDVVYSSDGQHSGVDR